MVAPLDSPSFDYGSLPPAERAWLRDKSAAVQTTARRIAGDLVLLGLLLDEVRRRIGHGRFLKWRDAELPFSRKQTYRLIGVGKAFGGSGYKVCHGDKFEASALYLLAQPSTPRPAREYAIELAESGERVTAAVARQIVGDWRRPPRMAAAEVRTLAPDRPDDRAPPSPPADSLGSALAVALAGASALHLSRVEVDGDSHVDAVVFPDDGSRPVRVGGESVRDVLFKLIGREETKVCGRCRQAKPLPQFSRLTAAKDGRNHNCRDCETRRVRAYKSRKKKAGDNPAA